MQPLGMVPVGSCTPRLVRLAGSAEEGKFVVMLETKSVPSLHSNDLHNFAWHMAHLVAPDVGQISVPFFASYDFDSPLFLTGKGWVSFLLIYC